MSSEREELCFLVETLRRIGLKIHQNLAEALERTPHIISSRALIESSLRLSESLINIVRDMDSKMSCGAREED